MSIATTSSLHEHVGGAPAVELLVDRFYERLRIDDVAFDRAAEHLTITLRELEIDPSAITLIDGAVKGFRSQVVTA